MTMQLTHTPWRLLSSAATWHVTSQQQARHNALVASTALMERRREILEVEEFLAAHSDRHQRPAVPAHRTTQQTTQQRTQRSTRRTA